MKSAQVTSSLIARIAMVGTFAITGTTTLFGQSISLVPVSSSGVHVINNDEIKIAAGGATVDFELVAADWSNAAGSPPLEAVFGAMNQESYLGANASPPQPGVDLLPLGYALPDPNGGTRGLGFFVVTNVCSISGRDCSFGQPPCAGADGSCEVNSRWVVSGCFPIAFAATSSLRYEAGAVCQSGGVLDHHDANRGYFGTLRLVVPPEAVGTYEISLFNDSGMNFTYITTIGGFAISPVELRTAKITVTDFSVPDPALGITKNRYVSFVPATGISVAAYRVELLSSTLNPAAVGFIGWLGEPVIQAGVVGTVSEVVSAPVFRTWSELAVNVGDCEIMPGSVYELRSTTDGITFSSPITISTTPQPSGKDWGDVVGVFDGAGWTPPNGIANVSDIVGIIAAREGKPAAPAAVRCDLETVSTTDSCLNQLLNAGDIFVAVLAVRGVPYPFERNPAMCLPCP